MSLPSPSAAKSEHFDPLWRMRIERAGGSVAAALLAARGDASWWTGELSSSALSTATAITALTLVSRHDCSVAENLRVSIAEGFAWLIRNQNDDGGWGDTTKSFSNISTTALVWAALALCDDPKLATDQTDHAQAVSRAEAWLTHAAGSVVPKQLVAAIEQRYGDDRTFSIPILTMCALCGRLGPPDEAWRRVQQLPFELAALPQAWFGALRLPVVSYALPALIAIGQVHHGLQPTTNPALRWLRDRCRALTLKKLQQLQPENGGFLEAAPLTSFVVMSLAALGHTAHPVVRRGVAFLEASRRPDGSWPIDTNLTTWLTTLSVNALTPESTSDRASAPLFTERDGDAIRDWLLRQQYRRVHPYTLAAPGGWAWTDLPGGVPDADDTAGAIVALMRLGNVSAASREAVLAGVGWLLQVQNRDGGIPTFCRGWGRLPFDRSSPDITAHAIRAWKAAEPSLPGDSRRAVHRALTRALDFLRCTQRTNGTWIPLWFGHQEHPADENPLYGTTRVLLALLGIEERSTAAISDAIDRALSWLIANQNHDGGWSGASGATSSLEETGLAVEALAVAWAQFPSGSRQRTAVEPALLRGGNWLANAIEQQRWREPAPIGFYFAKLWYFERLYPLIFATAALERLIQLSRKP